MLGSTPLSAVLGCGVDGTNPDAVKTFIRAACNDVGLSLLLCIPGTKVPADCRTPRIRNAADKAAREAAHEAGVRNWARVKSPAGLALASSEATTVLKYLKHYYEIYGEDVAVNLAVETGGSRLVVVDCDTRAQVERFLTVVEAPMDMPPTVSTPGAKGSNGEWIHRDGGHFYFTVPEGVDLPTNVGALNWGGDDGFAVLWHHRYVLIPPSVRPEGSYELVGRDYPLPGWLQDAIVDVGSLKAQRAEERRASSGDGEDATSSAIDEWAESTPWSLILEPLGWTPATRVDNCGCEIWTAGPGHASDKSATAHDSGCGLGRYTETNAPLHVWTDNPGPEFAAWFEAHPGTSTVSKLQAVAAISYDGNVGVAMDRMDLGPDLGIAVEGVDVTAMKTESDGNRDTLAEDFTLPEAETDNASPSTGNEQWCVECDGYFPQEAFSIDADGDRWHELSDDNHLADSDDAGAESPFENTDAEPDVFNCGVMGVPRIAPFSHWRDLPPPEYIIDGLIENGGLSSVIGHPGVGKSSVVLDMLCHIATGRPWQGRRTLKTRVLYLPGEGLSGAVQRIIAWEEAHEVVLGDGLMLGDSIIKAAADKTAWAALTGYVAAQQIGLIVFDTLARMATNLEENSASDMGLVVSRFDRVKELTSAGVMVVHHTAKNSESGRGSSAIQGALESELLIRTGTWNFEGVELDGDEDDRPEGKRIELLTTKQKNAPQLEDPLPLLMRNWEPNSAPYITGPNGSVDPMDGEIVMARPTPESIVETAIRITEYAARFPQQGVTRGDVVRDVRPDPYTAVRTNASRHWRSKVNEAVDRALRYRLIQGLTDTPSAARYIPGDGTAQQAREAYAAEVMGDDD